MCTNTLLDSLYSVPTLLNGLSMPPCTEMKTLMVYWNLVYSSNDDVDFDDFME
jgi:hypothetical protein